MNAQNAHEYLPLIYALANGKIIQFRNAIKNEWEDLETVDFNYSTELYRIKPEPLRWSMVRCLNNGFIYQDTGTDKFNSDIWERIIVQEVLQ